MALRVFITKLIARPILIPVGIGSFGLWYGAFDVSYIVSSKVAGTLDSSLVGKTTPTNKAISSLAGVSLGSVFVYASYVSSPIRTATFPEIELKSIMRQLPAYFKQNMEIIRNLNMSRGVLIFVGSGFISGFCKCFVECYLSQYV